MSKINLNGKMPVYRLLIEAKKPVLLRFQGVDNAHPNTVYFDRYYNKELVKTCLGDECKHVVQKFKGRKWFEFPLPLVPDTLEILVSDKSGKNTRSIKILKKVIDTRPFALLQESEMTMAFIPVAEKFAKEAGYLPTKTYEWGGFAIRYFTKIKDAEGKVLSTPARVSHKTGVIEVAKREFKYMTVPVRFFILLHELCHYQFDNRDEFFCDAFAANICLRMGISQLECLYALAKLFEDNGEDPKLIKEQQTARVMAMLQFIRHFNHQIAA